MAKMVPYYEQSAEERLAWQAREFMDENQAR
jgi:hypothetical protein